MRLVSRLVVFVVALLLSAVATWVYLSTHTVVRPTVTYVMLPASCQVEVYDSRGREIVLACPGRDALRVYLLPMGRFVELERKPNSEQNAY
jgi:hypothetical protein